jgi:2-keto-3-deoxy-L-rhamnonate aldolase RhmA
MGIDPRKAAQDDRHARALEQILTACRNTGKAPGLACPTPQDAKQRAEQGFQFLTAGSDVGFMLGGARAGLPVLGL